MPNIIEITDLEHPGLAPYFRLTEAQLRNKRNPAEGIFIAESHKVIGHALDSGCEPVSFLMERRQIEGVSGALLSRCPDTPVYTADREVLAQLTGYELTRGCLCAMRRPAPKAVAEVTENARRIAVLDGIADATNVGAILRSAAALCIKVRFIVVPPFIESEAPRRPRRRLPPHSGSPPHGTWGSSQCSRRRR